MRLFLMGLGIGACGAFGLAQSLRAWLFDISPFDVLSVALSVLLLCLVTAAATLIPATRAARIEPWRALREN